MALDNHFITKIHILELMNISNASIELSGEKRQHLLFTGKNGSGKTSMLNALKMTLSAINKGKRIEYKKYESAQDDGLHGMRDLADELYQKYVSGVMVDFNSDTTLDNAFMEGRFVTAFYPANRRTEIDLAHGVENIQLSSVYAMTDDPAKLLLQGQFYNLVCPSCYKAECLFTKSQQLLAFFDSSLYYRSQNAPIKIWLLVPLILPRQAEQIAVLPFQWRNTCLHPWRDRVTIRFFRAFRFYLKILLLPAFLVCYR